MKTYVIRRENAWQTVDDLKAAGERSAQVGEENFPDDIRWIRSYIVEEDGGMLGSCCIYQASGPDAIRDHAKQAGMPADEIFEVADTVILASDP